MRRKEQIFAAFVDGNKNSPDYSRTVFTILIQTERVATIIKYILSVPVKTIY